MLPKPQFPQAPPIPKASPLHALLPEPGQVLEQAQALLDSAAALPLAWVWAALGLSVLFIALHRHSQRLLSGCALGALVVWYALRVLAPEQPGSMAPGLLAILGGGAAVAFGLGLPGWATAVASALLSGALGGFLAAQFAHAPWLAGALLFGLLGFFVGLTNHLVWGVLLPPVFSALGLTAFALRFLGAEDRGARVPQLLQLPAAAALFAVLAVLLVGLSVEREHRRKRRAAGRTRQLGDIQLTKKLERDRKLFAKHLGGGAGPGSH